MFKRVSLENLAFWKQWLIHCLCLWLALNLFDSISYLVNLKIYGNFLFNPDGSSVTVWQRFNDHNFNQLLWLDILVLTFFVEGNYFIFSKKRNTGRLLLTSLSIGVGLIILLLVRQWWQQHKIFMFDILVPVSVISGYSFIYALGRDYIVQKIKKSEEHYHSSSAELMALKAQINPHFLFNTLNSIYGTALREKASQTVESIGELSNIMRYTMEEGQNKFTPVSNEIKFLEDYLHLQKIRFPERQNIDIQTEIIYDGLYCQIAPMLLVPFVENAFKYGISITQHCYVKIVLKVENRMLNLLVENKILEFKRSEIRGSSGIGIDNTIKRLKLLYPRQHNLDIQKNEIFSITLQINLHK